MYSLLHILATWFQPEASSSGGSATGAAKGAGGGDGANAGLTQIGLMALMMVVFYLVLIRPQQKKQKQLDTLLKGLKKGQKVRTTGGIRGVIVDFKSEQGDEVVLEIADKVKVNVLRTHVAGMAEPAAEPEKKS